LLHTSPYSLDCSNACFECFRVTSGAGRKHLIHGDRSAHGALLLQCADLCRRVAQALILGAPLAIEHLVRCAAFCETCADLCEESDMDECAVTCWEATAALRDLIDERRRISRTALGRARASASLGASRAL
jgi:hypothetical protein